MNSDTLGKLDAWETSINEQVGSEMDRKRCQDESATVHGNYGKHGRLRKEAGAPAELTKNPYG